MWNVRAAGNSYENWRQNSTTASTMPAGALVPAAALLPGMISLTVRTYVGQGTLPGDYAYEDWNGDGMISDLDVHPIAYNGIPLVNYGLMLGGSWKGAGPQPAHSGRQHGEYRLQRATARNPSGAAAVAWLCSWTGGIRQIPRRTLMIRTSQWIPGKYAYTGTVPDENSGFNVQNAAYVRLKSAEIGYSLPEKLAARIGLGGVRAYVNGYNLITITDIKYVDPEHPATLYSYLYPLNRTFFRSGLNVKF